MAKPKSGDLTWPQRDLLAVLPDEEDGKFLKGPRLRVADALVKLGLAEKVSTGYIGIGGRYRRTRAGSAALHSPTKLDALGVPLDDNALYYVQDTRQVVGNCVLWWCAEAKGYTCELGEAGEYTGAEARGMRGTDVPWPVAAVRSVAVQHVRSEGLARLREERRAG